MPNVLIKRVYCYDRSEVGITWELLVSYWSPTGLLAWFSQDLAIMNDIRALRCALSDANKHENNSTSLGRCELTSLSTPTPLLRIGLLLCGTAIGHRCEKKGVHNHRFLHPQSVREVVWAGLERGRGKKFRGLRDARDQNIYVLYGGAGSLRFTMEVR